MGLIKSGILIGGAYMITSKLTKHRNKSPAPSQQPAQEHSHQGPIYPNCCEGHRYEQQYQPAPPYQNYTDNPPQQQRQSHQSVPYQQLQTNGHAQHGLNEGPTYKESAAPIYDEGLSAPAFLQSREKST